jgi:hypothetical protein
MKIIQSRKPTMKTFLSTAILLTFLWSLNLNTALAQRSPAPVLPDPNEAPPPGVLPTLSADEPTGVPGTGRRFGGGGGGGGLAQSGGYYAAYAKPYGSHPASAGSAVIIQFSQPDPQNVDTLQEDLNVMSLLLQKKIESAFGENSPTYRMGIPLLLRAGQHDINSLFLDGFGAVFALNVNFPLVAPPASKAKETDDTTGSDDWEKARKELYGVRETEETANPYARAGLPYDAAQVGALKRALLEALKNAANIRGLKSEEWIVATVFGAENVDSGPGMAGSSGGGGSGGGGMTGRYGAGRSASNVTAAEATLLEFVGGSMPATRTGRGTVLNVRVRKADAEAFAKGKMNFDQFEQKATIAAYLGPATHGGNAFFRGGSYPGRYPGAPVAR